MAAAAIHVGIVDDHEAVRIGFAASAARDSKLNSPAIVVTRAASTVSAFLGNHTSSGSAAACSVVALDMMLADGTAPQENVSRLMAAGHRVLVYSGADNVDNLKSALAAGALGVASKSHSLADTMAMIRQIVRGEPLASWDAAAAIDGDSAFVKTSLSIREREALELYASGFDLESAGRKMNCTTATVKKYIDRCRQKYVQAGRPAPTKIDLYRRAIEDGILPPVVPLDRP